MKLWLSKNGGIPIRDQLTRQVILAIISGDLKKGDKLPSVRELALRHQIHANTAGSAYRWLEENGWVEARVGSGVFVRAVSQTKIDEAARNIESDLDRLIQTFLGKARQLGFDKKQIKSRLYLRLNGKAPRKIVVIEPDADLSRILTGELSDNFSLPISAIKNESNNFTKDSLIVSLAELDAEFSAQTFVKLKLNSVQDAMRGQKMPEETDLIGIASHWEMFRRWAQTMLIAVGISEENLVARDTNEIGWQKGLELCRFVIADNLTAKNCGKLKNIVVFRLISEDSIEEIRNLINDA